MENLTTLLNMLEDATVTFTVQDVILVLVLSYVLSLFIGYIYKITHRGTSYSQSFVHTLVLVSMVVAIIMLVVGSNIARAFTLVGALSIIRFRNAAKETRDVGFIFFAMAIGMAVGTRFMLLAVIATLTIGLLMWAMVKMNLFAKEVQEQMLKIRLPADIPYDTVFEDVFRKYLVSHELRSIETVQAGTLTELVHTIRLRRGANAQEMLEDVRRLNQNNKVVLITGHHEVDL